VRRLHWGFADQVLSSATNFALSVAVARQVDPRAFGAFGLAMTAYILATGLSRAVVSEPLLVGFSAAADGERRRGFAAASGTALALGAAGGAVCVAAAWVAGGEVTAPLAVLGVMLPLLLLQDAWRYAFLAAGRPRAAAANDGVWAVAQVVTIGACVAAGADSAAPYVLAWAAAAAVAAAWGIRQSGVAPRIDRTTAWLRAQRELAPRYSAEFVARAGAQQAATVAVGAVAGLAALGGIKAAQALLGPLRVFLLAAPLIFIPEAVRLREEDPDKILGLVRWVSWGLAGLALVAGVAALAIPDAIGEALVGRTWHLARPALLPQAALMATFGVNAGALAGLRALADPRRSLRARLSVVPLSIAGGVGGAVLTGTAAGALWGLALGNAVGAAIWWMLFRRSLDEFRASRDRVDRFTSAVSL
jgi:O-antigen/teichoic acid export membrane protein